MERVHVPLRRGPDDAGPAHQSGSQRCRQIVPCARQERDGPLQHAVVRRCRLHRWHMARLGRMGAVLSNLRWRHQMAGAQRHDGGHSLWHSGAGRQPADCALQHHGLLRRRRVLVQPMERVGRLFVLLQWRQAPLSQDCDVWTGQWRGLQRCHEGGFALQRGRNHPWLFQGGCASGLQVRQLDGLEQVQRHLQQRPESAPSEHRNGGKTWREGLCRGALRGGRVPF
mmetsp:Transcript_138760/g.386962  ORF Transcript_138760/g.386962 Transcript_138760/m.386962 type:complete len:226 (-) Transcript_138760:876-1553(-)